MGIITLFLYKYSLFLGCKMNNVSVVYTPWANLKKTADMDVGQIGFHKQKDVSIFFLPDLSKDFKLLSPIRPRS